MKGQLILLETLLGVIILFLALLLTQPLYHSVAPLARHYYQGDVRLLSTPLMAEVEMNKP